VEKLPVTLSRNRHGWWLWWLPHPHIGGKPYTVYSASLKIDPLACAATELGN